MISTTAFGETINPIKAKITISRFKTYTKDKQNNLIPENEEVMFSNDFAVPDKNLYYYSYKFNAQEQLMPLTSSTTYAFEKIARENNLSESDIEHYRIQKNGISLKAKINHIFSDPEYPSCNINRTLSLDYSKNITTKYEDKGSSTACPYYYRVSVQLLTQ